MAVVLALQVSPPAHTEPASGAIEGRPTDTHTSPLQARVDAARPGERIDVAAGDYVGDLLIDRSVQLIGRDRPRLIGSGAGSVVRIRAAGVVVDGFDIDGRGGGDLGRDSSGVHVAAKDVTIRNCRVVNSLFGVYLREANGSRVEGCVIRGIPGKDPGEKGSGVHVWNTEGFALVGNDVADARDGFYIQSSSHGLVARNTARDVRYGLHYMFADDNVFEDNVFANGAAGAALMYSRRIAFRRNRFLRNRGFASVGLLFKTCDDVLAEDNLIADNARGVFLEGSNRTRFRRNIIAQSDAAIVLYASSSQVWFEHNSIVGAMTPLVLVGKRVDASFDGNYWSANDEPDFDGDGLSDRPYRLSSVFDHFRGTMIAADLMADGFAARALAAAEQTFPVLEMDSPEDRAPLVRPPSLPDVPPALTEGGGADPLGVAAALAAVGFGAMTVGAGRRPRAAPRPS
jgi:nitrous oxidase accessory protein